MTANDRHAIPPFPPSHATVPSPDKLSQHTFQFVDAQRLFRDQFVALVDDELRLGELRKRILRFRCRRLRIIAHKIMMPNDAQGRRGPPACCCGGLVPPAFSSVQCTAQCVCIR